MTTRNLIALRLPTGPTMIEAVQRIWDDGDAVCPIDPALPTDALERLLATMRPSSLGRPSPGERPGVVMRSLPDPRPVSPGTAVVVPTSGTSGEPKGVELTHAALTASVQASLTRLGCEQGEQWLLCLPLHHVAGLQVVVRSMALDTEPVVLRGFDAEAVAGDSRATRISLVPTQLRRLLEAGVDLARFRTILVGGSRLDPDLRARAAEADARIVTSYGLTETCGGCVYDGRPLDGVEVDITRDGRIAVRGDVLMRGYRGRPDLTAEVLHDGWLVTPDRGRIDDDGRLHVEGRADDVIVTGGENVAPGAVAAALSDHPEVAEIAVTSRPDPEWGEIVVAVVVPADPATPPSLSSLRQHARDTLAPHALPREVVLRDALPRNDMGKVSRPALRALVS